MNVMVVGAGLGGLALAQGLRRHGVGVEVYERDRSPSDRLQGYRLHINPSGSRALHECLPPELFAAFIASCGQPNTGIGVFTHRLRELAWFGGDTSVADPVDSFKSVSRISLRHVLLSGLEDVVHFDRSFAQYELDGDRVTAHFAGGQTATGDVLVGADGGGSRVRRQYLPHAERIDTGVTGIQGKVWLSGDVAKFVPQRLWEGPIMIPGQGGFGMFIAVHQFQPIPAEVEQIVGPEAAGQRDYVMWGLLGPAAKLPSDLVSLDPPGLRSLAQETIRGWHPTLRRLVDMSDLDTMLLTPIRTSVPVEPWRATPVTLLGDAIHSMPPTGGVGANTSLQDAALLTRHLLDAANGRVDTVAAIASYEAGMRQYAFDAVASSMRNLRRQQRTANPLIRMGMQVALRSIGTRPSVRQRALG